MTGTMPGDVEKRTLLRLIVAALLIRFLVALAASPFADLGDQYLYKVWANHAVDDGIHQAYSWGYDWLPFYLYLSKLVGLVYRYSGLADSFGPTGSALTLLLKVPMILLNVLIGWLIYRLGDRLYGREGHPLRAAAAYLFNPALILASAVFGYQDALHTTLVFTAVFALCVGRHAWVPVLAALAFLTKPQAALFLLPIGVVLFLRSGARGLIRGATAGTVTAGFVLLPFIFHGELTSVFEMYLSVTRIHKWLTGCAHNIWWIHWPAPPFRSDRIPLVFGLNGLTLGLLLFGLFSLGTLIQLVRKPTNRMLVHLCAFLAFAFFMVVTEIHENHLYAMFAFLAVFVPVSRPLRWLYAGLSVTFGLGIALTLWLMHTHSPVMVGAVRLSLVNAVANVVMLGIWSYLVLVRQLPLGPETSPPLQKRRFTAATSWWHANPHP